MAIPTTVDGSTELLLQAVTMKRKEKKRKEPTSLARIFSVAMILIVVEELGGFEYLLESGQNPKRLSIYRGFVVLL